MCLTCQESLVVFKEYIHGHVTAAAKSQRTETQTSATAKHVYSGILLKTVLKRYVVLCARTKVSLC